jgi:hypothetical protein
LALARLYKLAGSERDQREAWILRFSISKQKEIWNSILSEIFKFVLQWRLGKPWFKAWASKDPHSDHNGHVFIGYQVYFHTL